MSGAVAFAEKIAVEGLLLESNRGLDSRTGSDFPRGLETFKNIGNFSTKNLHFQFSRKFF